VFLELLSLVPWEKKGKSHHFSDDHEDFFTNLLTESRSCGMIGRAWIRPAVGMRMQRRRLPLGLLFSPRLSTGVGDYILQREGRRRFRGKRVSPLSQM
jgi:hypothetical protein